MPTDLDNIIAKVKKLQSLAKNNSNQNEMLAATKVAEQLISIHRLTTAQLESEGVVGTEEFKDEIIIVLGRRIKYCEVLLDGLCKHWGGAWFVCSRRNENNKGECTYHLTSKKSDWQIIHYFLSYLMFEIDRIAKTHCSGLGLSESNSFRVGAALGINSLFDDQKAKMRADANNCTALIVLDKRAVEANKEMYARNELGKAKHITGGTNQDARSRGYSAGRQVSINSALNK